MQEQTSREIAPQDIAPQDITPQDIEDAYGRTRSYVNRTPLVRAERLEPLFGGAQVWLKLESMQHTGSFKIRGVANKMLSLSKEELACGVTAASSGNHAQAVAYFARHLQAKACIVMPENAPRTKVDGVRGYGAQVIQYGFTGEDRDRRCGEIIASEGYCLVHSHKDPLLIAGHGSIALEIREQESGFTDLVLPCGAGSLTAGAAFAAKLFLPGVAVTAVEPAAVPRFTQSIKAQRPVTVPLGETIADGLRVGKAEEINYRLIRDHVDRLLTAQEEDIRRAVVEILGCAGVLAEPSAAIGIAAALAGSLDMGPGRKVCFVITGGNMDLGLLCGLLL
ncbi:MAG: threonine/serine dehydratase [Lachnospiraceae bacterium]|jgi:threonine dehydratase|nr:threonine/serine dehydratase [Lachnospiraceae bacterium]